MTQSARSRILNPMTATVLAGATGVAAALLVGAATIVVAPQPATALPAYAQQTGKACGYCHVSPGGGGALTAAGQKFQKNGHKL